MEQQQKESSSSNELKPPSIKKKGKKSLSLAKQERGLNVLKEETTVRNLVFKVMDKFMARPPTMMSPKDTNLQDRYTAYDKWIDRLVKLRIIEPRGDFKERERVRMKQKGGIQTNLGIEKIGRALSNAENVKRKYGAKKRATKEYIYAEVHKYYKIFGGLITMRHWRVEKWFGIPVKVWIFIYLCIGGLFVVGVSYWMTKPVKVNGNKKILKKRDTKHIPYVLEKLSQNEKINEYLGKITEHKLTMLPPADRSNFRARFVHEV